MSLFLAWMPEGTALERLCALRDGLRRHDAGASWKAWRKDAQLHMTLRHLSEDPPTAPTGLRQALDSVAARHAEIAMEFDRVEAWTPALVARTASNAALAALLKDLDAAAVASGYPRMGTQTPHVTLAYPPRGVRGDMLAVPPPLDPDLLPIAAQIRNISVVQTITGLGYRRLASWPLRPV